MQYAVGALQVLSACFAIYAAVFWRRSAVIKAPAAFSIHVVRPHDATLGGDPPGGTYVGQAYSDDIEELGAKLREQSALSARAAIYTGISALFAALSALLQVFLILRA